MANPQDLDLTKLETNDTDQIVAKIENAYKLDNRQKTSLAYNWERNHLMLDGQQWLVYEGNRDTGGLWKRLEPSPANQYIPRPVTNYLYDIYQTLKGYLLKNRPRITVRPNTATNKDRVAAKIAELVSEANWERLHEQENNEICAANALVYGTVFKKSYWDTSYASVAKVPRMQEQPVTDPNTGMPTGQVEEIPVIDPSTGAPAFDEIPLGDVATAVIEPYRMSIDPLAVNLHEARWIMEFSIRPLSWIIENYDKQNEGAAPDPATGLVPQQEGYTGRAKEVKPEKTLPASMRRFFQLRTGSGVKGMVNNSLGQFTQSGDLEMVDESAIVKEYYERPSYKNPKGRLFVVANGVMLYAGPSPCEGPEQGDWHPYSEFRWEIVPGRFWGKSPFDDSVDIQKQINSIDSIIVLTRKTMAVPQKLIPRGSIKIGNDWTGQPGQKIEFTPTPEGLTPTTIPGAGVDPSVWQERSQRVDDLKQVTGAVDILKGDRPQGVTAYSALSLLFEVGTGKLFPSLDRWKRFIESDQKKQLRLVARKYREPRPEFIKMLLSKNQDLTPDQIKDFIGKDLNDNCNACIEASSSIPMLKAAEHAKLMELAQLGVLNLENPANRTEFLEKFGIMGFDTDYSKDAKRAQWENDLLDDMVNDPNSKPVMMTSDNNEIHKAVHEDRTKDPSFMSLPFQVQQAYFMHIEEHEQAIQMALQMQQMQAMMAGAPPPPPQENPMDAQQRVGKGKGASKEVSQIMAADTGGPFAASLKGR